MSFFDKIVDKLFPAKNGLTTQIREVMHRSEKDQKAYEQWKNNGEQPTLLQKVAQAYYYNKTIDMENEQELKSLVRERYAKIAEQGKAENASSCCGATNPSDKVYNIMVDDYSETNGYVEDADLGLGCGLPTQFAKIQKGDTVIDLGSGAGNDCFVARHETGSELMRNRPA